MKNTSFFAALIALSFTFSNCQKDNSEPNDDGNNNQNVLCEGLQGNNSFMPLAKDNYWEYGYNYYTSGGENVKQKISGQTTFDNKTYFVVHHFGGLVPNEFDTYLRRDDATGDIFEYIAGSGDQLLIPGNPTVGQELGQEPGNWLVPSRQVVNTNATVVTKACTYTGCLLIENFGQSGGSVGRAYYKKGLGLVFDTDLQLKTVTLK